MVAEVEKSLYGVFENKGEFYKRLGVYLKSITGNSCKFKIKRISNDFIVLRIYSPIKYTKGVKISDFLDFFDKDSLGGGVDQSDGSEAAEDGEDLRSDPPAIGGGGGGGC